jgi:hypothetical protein
VLIEHWYDPERHGDYLDIDDCAERMGLSVQQVMELVRRGALRALDCGTGAVLLVQPAITNVTP